jgi:hypothetical protein
MNSSALASTNSRASADASSAVTSFLAATSREPAVTAAAAAEALALALALALLPRAPLLEE